MRTIDDDELAAYLDSEDWRGKAGGYGIQSRAAGIVTAHRGAPTPRSSGCRSPRCSWRCGARVERATRG
jgi:hypothetical protein